jgi:hypothetical protein
MKKLLLTLSVLVLVFGYVYYKNLKSETVPAPIDTWIGTWIGPEGTLLSIVNTEEKAYTLNFTMLDGPITTSGVLQNDGILFTRSNETYTLKKGTGLETGMKWLVDKKNCVVVMQSEGYCRD